MALLGVSARHHHHHHQASLADVDYMMTFGEGEGEGEKKGSWTPADSRKLFEKQVAEAANVVKTQQGFEKTKTADVAKRNAKNTADTLALRNHVSAGRTRQTAGEYPQNPYPTVKQWAAAPQFIQLAGDEETKDAPPAPPKKGTPADSYKQKADSLRAVTAAVAEQKRFMAEHNKMVADNFAADDLAAKTERARVSRARQTQLQGGLDY